MNGFADKDFKIKQKINAKGYFGGNKTFYDKIEDKTKLLSINTRILGKSWKK